MFYMELDDDSLDESRNWRIGKIINEGGFSMIHVLTNLKDNSLCVGKIIDKNKKKEYKYIENEINLHKTLHHENIVEMITTFQTDNLKIVVLQYYESGSLEDLIKTRRKIPEDECHDLFKQILNGLQYLKNNDIVHRDIKPGNILLKQNLHKATLDIESEYDCFVYDVKIGDFGFSTLVTDNTCIQEIGTPNFMAPEMLFGGWEINTETNKATKLEQIKQTVSNNLENNFKIDIWSTGTTFYTCLVGIPPFETMSIQTTYNLIMTAQYQFPERPRLSKSVKLLIDHMLEKDVTNRKSVEELINNEFFIE